MSTEKRQINRLEAKVFILRKFVNNANFCRVHGINYNTFRLWLTGCRILPSIDAAILSAAEASGYDIEQLYERE